MSIYYHTTNYLATRKEGAVKNSLKESGIHGISESRINLCGKDEVKVNFIEFEIFLTDR